MSAADTIKTISGQLSGIFRHIIPGVIILGFAYGSHPSWFKKVYPTNSTDWMVLAMLSIVIGNLWYVVHRFTIHFLFDFICYRFREGKWSGYQQWLIAHIDHSFAVPEYKRKLQNFVHCRSSQIILLFIIAEALIIFSLWFEAESVFSTYNTFFLIVGVVLFLVAVVHYPISNNLDIFVVRQHTIDATSVPKHLTTTLSNSVASRKLTKALKELSQAIEELQN